MSVRRSFLTNVKGKDFGEKHYKHCKVVLQSKKLTVCKTNISEVCLLIVFSGNFMHLHDPFLILEVTQDCLRKSFV